MKQRELDGINILVAARNLWLMELQLDCIHYNRGRWLDEFILNIIQSLLNNGLVRMKNIIVINCI